MLYLEDYLEMIEHLPQELRDRFTEMRELDLSVQNSVDSLEKKTRVFFSQCKRGELQNDAADNEYQSLRKEYYKVLEDADEKVTIASQIHELVERYLRRLDSELFKFKCELEADNNGITEILEKRSLEMDGGSTAATALLGMIGANQKENRYFSSLGSVASSGSGNSHSMLGSIGNTIGSSNIGMSSVLPTTPTSATKDNRYRSTKLEKRRDSQGNVSGIPEKRPNLGNNLTPATPPVTAVSRPITPGLGGQSPLINSAAAGVSAAANPAAVAYNLQLGSGSATNAIAAAASQAIVATQQMQQGRRTASLKASYEAIHGVGGGPTEFWISRDIASAATVTTQNALQGTVTSEKKHKKKVNSNAAHIGTTGGTGGAISNAALSSLSAGTANLGADSLDTLTSSSAAAVVANVVGVPTLTSLTSGSSSTTASTAGSVSNRGGSASSSSSSSVLTTTASANLPTNENGFVVEQTVDGDWSYDPNEPRYCTCNQVSYGDMVACDNEACPYEWFHYPCVGITQPPKGKWYCPKCTASMRRRGNRKN